MKKKVAFIGGRSFDGLDNVFGGAPMTVRMFLQSFQNDPEFEIVTKYRNDIRKKEDVLEFIEGSDIFHLDDALTAGSVLNWGIQPDVIGPITRSPVKDYKGWTCPYTVEQFYKSKIIRLNEAEERGTEWVEKLNFIDHAVDTDALKPLNKGKSLVLWAGDGTRSAKNFSLFHEIMQITQLHPPYKFKFISGYNVDYYFKLLDQTALLINTSKGETFCCAMFEAKAKGVPCVYRKGMHGNLVHQDCKIQVEYNPYAYKEAILYLLSDKELLKESGIESRQYAEQHASMKAMRNSIAKVYHEVLNERKTV